MTDPAGDERTGADDVPALEDALLRNQRIWIVGVDGEGAVTVWNDAAAAATGYPPSAVRGDDGIWEALAPDEVERVDVPDRVREMEALPEESAEATIETAIRTADGERRVIAWYATGEKRRIGGETDDAKAGADDAHGDGTLLLARDVTRRRRRETQLERINQAMRELLTAESRAAIAEIAAEAAHDVLGLEATTVYLAEEDETVLRPTASTEAAEKLSGGPPVYRAGDSIVWRAYERGRTSTIGDVRTDPDVHNPDTPIRSQLNLPLEDHGVLVVGSREVDAFDEHDRTVGEVLAGNVVAALDSVERQQSLARQNERLEQFSWVVSHDIRNPLNVARGRVDLAREDGDVQHLAAADRSLDRIETLVEDLLELARDGRPSDDREPVSLRTLVDACRETVDVEHVDLRVETDRTVLGDRSRLQQLFENLIRNAIEHGSPDDDRRGDEPVDGHSRVTVAVGDLEDGAGFFVEDDGPGIPPEDRQRAFDPGFSTATDGTGFGLSIVGRIADDHGWTVRATEGGLGGARFEFRGVDRVDGDVE